jgi:membrane-associated phospholipid phosphatase
LLVDAEDCGTYGERTNKMNSKPGAVALVLVKLALVCSCCPAIAGVARAQDAVQGGTESKAVPAAEDASANGPGSEAAQSAGKSPTIPSGTATRNVRDVSEGTLFLNILHDQKDLWLFPLQLGRGRHWLPAVAIAGGTAGLVVLDPHDTPYFRRTATFGGFNRAFGGNITIAEILVAPASFYTVGLVDKDRYARETGLFAAEALADVTILDVAMKAVTRRLRPSDIPPYGNFSDTFFEAKHSPLSTSFPSGHTISAFAVATVISERYGKRHRWVPYAAYGVAGVIGFSRVTLQAHFPSDVFLGAALGYAVARFDVLRKPGAAAGP